MLLALHWWYFCMATNCTISLFATLCVNGQHSALPSPSSSSIWLKSAFPTPTMTDAVVMQGTTMTSAGVMISCNAEHDMYNPLDGIAFEEGMPTVCVVRNESLWTVRCTTAITLYSKYRVCFMNGKKLRSNLLIARTQYICNIFTWVMVTSFERVRRNACTYHEHTSDPHSDLCPVVFYANTRPGRKNHTLSGPGQYHKKRLQDPPIRNVPTDTGRFDAWTSAEIVSFMSMITPSWTENANKC